MAELIISIEKKRRNLNVDALQAFARKAQAATRLKGAISVLVTGDEQMRRLNRMFRRKDKPTDVLSFPGAAAGVAGDIAISVDIAQQNAGHYGHALEEEIQVLLLHGMLHLAGYDHENDGGAMERKESLLRKRLGLPGALISRSQESMRVRKRKKP